MSKRLGFIWAARQRIKLIWALLRDKRIPLWKKAIPLLPILYLVSPWNILSFAIPIIGQIDDMFMLIASTKLFEWLVDRDILMEHRQRLGEA